MLRRSNIQGKRVLIVDDSLQMQRLVRQILESAGIEEAICASNGIEALEQLRRRSFDVVIADWLMPEMDGLAFIAKMREDPSKAHATVPVIMLTGQSTASDVKTALAVGINGYVVKPCTPNALIGQIEKVLA
jgi:CheY-like chemotaxis protein